MKHDIEELISVPMAAKRAGVARNTMLLAAKKGTIKAVKPGRDWLIVASDIARWKEEVYRPDKAVRFPIHPTDRTDDPPP